MHKLPDLPYDFGALEPHIDARTMEIHHGKHHAAYVANLNKALEAAGGAFPGRDLETLLRNLGDVPDTQRTAVRNNGGGHWNHSLFWTLMGKGGGGEPAGALNEAIAGSFGSFADFKQKFSDAAMGRFGSGWAWLTASGDKLAISSTPNQDNPLMDGSGVPILGLDVWEHAYYLHYQNRRADYIAAWWNVVDWKAAARRFEALR